MARELPLVSGIVAAYNYERFLPDALDSALEQDYPADRLEVIVIDDGSTDGTAEIAQRYARESSGIIRYIRQDNAGLCAATNRGMREARGDMITILDADDAWITSRTRLLVDGLMRNPRAGIVYGDMEVIDGAGSTIAPSWLAEAHQMPYRGRVLPHLMKTNFVIAPSLMARAEFCERFCPIPTVFPAQDWYMASRVAEVAEIDFVPAAVARYRRHGENMSNGRVTPADVARLYRRDIVMRRWGLANLRAPDLTVEDLAEAYHYFIQTLIFAGREQGVPIECLVEVTDDDRAVVGREVAAGRAALAEADFAGGASHFVAALAADPSRRRRPGRARQRPAQAGRAAAAPGRRAGRFRPWAQLPPQAGLRRARGAGVLRRPPRGAPADGRAARRVRPRCVGGRPPRCGPHHRHRLGQRRQARSPAPALRDTRPRPRPQRRTGAATVPRRNVARARLRPSRLVAAHRAGTGRRGARVRERDRASAASRGAAREPESHAPRGRGGRHLHARA